MSQRRWLVSRTVFSMVAALLAAQGCWGAGWTAQNSGTTNGLKAVCFTDLNNGWAVGRAGMVRTTDGGATWVKVNAPAARSGLSGLCFVGTKLGWAVGGGDYGGLVLMTQDGGATWRAVQAPNDRGPKGEFFAVHFPDPNNGWAVGMYGVIMATKDGGRTWAQQGKQVTGQSLTGVWFVDAQKGWAVGRADASGSMGGIGGQLLQTTDGGANWSVVTKAGPGGNGAYNGIFFANPNLGWIGSGLGQIARTTDGGKTWTSAKTPGKWWTQAICFVDANLGWAVGGNRQILFTKDGGATWTPQTGTGGCYNAVCFVDAKNGWIVGDDGVILHTTTGGE